MNKIIIKHKALFIVVFFIIVIFVLLIYTARMNESFTASSDNVSVNKTVIIDAGHGGADGGTIGADGSFEKDINLQITEKIRFLLNLYGFKVILTRENDDSIHDSSAKTIRQKKISDIHNRLKIINDNPDAIFISIHQNHYLSSSVNGTQVFYSKNNKLSSLLAQCVQDSVVSNIQPDNYRKIKPVGTEIYLLYHSNNPSIMVECGFMSNSNDLKLLHDNEYQKKMSVSIVDGILKYYNGCEDYGSKK